MRSMRRRASCTSSARAAMQCPIKLLGPPREGERGWQGTLTQDEFGAYDSVLDAKEHPGRIAARCTAHARRKFDEFVKAKHGTCYATPTSTVSSTSSPL